MSVKFYIDNVEKNIETGASFRSTQDNSLDDGSLVLEWISSEETIKPRTPVRIDEINDLNSTVVNEWNFIVLSDDVEPVTKLNNLFSHRLTLIQNTNDLTHRFLRNSNFQQPLEEKTSLTIANGYVFAKKQNGVFSMSGKLVLPIWYNGTTPNYNTYRKDKIYISEKEKINNVYIDIDSWALCWSYPAKTGGGRINLTMAQSAVRNWIRNAHGSFYVILEYRQNENDSPSATTSIGINSGSRENKTQVQKIANSFVSTHGAGWYSVALDTSDADNLPGFILSNDEYYFAVTEDIDQAVSNVDYPTIQGRFEIKLRIDTYYYDIYDVLEIIQKQSLKTLNNIDRATSPYSLTNLGYLRNIVAPDFQFNGLNVFDAVSQVFNYIDAVPTLSKTKELGYEYLNEFDGEQLSSNYAFADKKTRIEDKYYDNQIITQYQNARQSSAITYPANNFYKKFETNRRGVVSNANDYIITTDKPIEKIDELNIYFNKSFDYTFSTNYSFTYGSSSYQITSVSFKDFNLPNSRINIVDRVVESSIFGTLDVGSASTVTNEKYQSTTLSFNRGSNNFQVGIYEELGYTSPQIQIVIEKCLHEQWDYNINAGDINLSKNTSWSYPNIYEYYYSIKYIPKFEGQIMIESPENKKEGQFVIAQTSSSTDINKMGTNMLGFIAKTGNESKAVTMQLTTYDQRLVKGSVWIDASGNKWIANIVKITFTTGNQIITEVEFVKNFNMISQRTQIDEEIKYGVINNQLANKGFENVNEYLYFSTSSISISESTSFTDTLVESLLKGTFVKDYTQPQVDYCSIHFDNLESTYVPLHVYGAGNVLCFEFNYEHPLQAGSYVTDSGTIQSINVLYTDKNGFGDTMYVLMRSNQASLRSQSNYPLTQTTDYNPILIGFNYKYYKKPNEILSFNYGIAFMPKPGEEIYFGEEFLYHNSLIPNNKYLNIDRLLRFYVSDEEIYNIGDKVAKGDALPQGSFNITVDMTNRVITFDTIDTSDPINVKSWCIADSKGNIYVACNQALTKVNNHYTARLYFAKKLERM